MRALDRALGQPRGAPSTSRRAAPATSGVCQRRRFRIDEVHPRPDADEDVAAAGLGARLVGLMPSSAFLSHGGAGLLRSPSRRAPELLLRGRAVVVVTAFQRAAPPPPADGPSVGVDLALAVRPRGGCRRAKEGRDETPPRAVENTREEGWARGARCCETRACVAGAPRTGANPRNVEPNASRDGALGDGTPPSLRIKPKETEEKHFFVISIPGRPMEVFASTD